MPYQFPMQTATEGHQKSHLDLLLRDLIAGCLPHVKQHTTAESVKTLNPQQGEQKKHFDHLGTIVEGEITKVLMICLQ